MLPPVRGMLLSVSIGVTASLAPAPAVARDTPYCKQVRARAQSDADLLMMPRVLAQGIRFPRGTAQFDSGPTTDNGYQLRTGLSFSFIDFYKGRATLRVGDAECERHEAAMDLDAVIARGADDARLSALREQSMFLRAKQADWGALQARASARLSKRIITVVEFTNVQHVVDGLERKLVQVEGDVGQLDAKAKARPLPFATLPGSGLPSATLPALADRYTHASLDFERETSSLRLLDDWKLQMTGGVIPQAPSDWYGTIELSFSLGGLVRGAHEDSYIEARTSTLANASDGVATRLSQFRAQVAALLEQTQRDLGVVERSLGVLRTTLRALSASEAESVAQAREILTIEEMSVESDAVFLRAMVRALETLAERARG
jgi:hypothetical protein